MRILLIFLFCIFNKLIILDASEFEILETPAVKNTLAPNLCAFGDQFALSWIERNKDGAAKLQMARWNGFAFDKKNGSDPGNWRCHGCCKRCKRRERIFTKVKK